MQTAQADIFAKSVNAIAASLGRPQIVNQYGKPVTSAMYTYQRTAAKREGSMRNWIPKRLLSRQAETIEREAIVARSIDLTNNDPNVAGLIQNYTDTVIGSGLKPYPVIDYEYLGIDKATARKIQQRMKAIYQIWSPYADATGRCNNPQIQYMKFWNMVEFGEYFNMYLMIKDPIRPYSLACQMIHPLRVKTPMDMSRNQNIRDGIEFDENGKPAFYWVKKAKPNALYLSDMSSNFVRVEAGRGHRHFMQHRFVQTDPEQVRGMPVITPAMKYFRDLSDLLDTELVSQIAAAAIAIWIETVEGQNPLYPAQQLANESVSTTDRDGNAKTERYQEIVPGSIYYGSSGEKPHLLAPDRPGNTFDPFIKTIKKGAAMAVGLPFPVAFNDVEGVNFAGFRSAMLSAWRVFMTRRSWMGDDESKTWAMLMEEAYLRGDIPEIKSFYKNRHHWTSCKWIGSPKGDIEPIKAAQANAIKVKERVKTRASWIIEDGEGDDPQSVFDAIDEELQMMDDKGIMPESELPESPQPASQTEDMAACRLCGWSGHQYDLIATRANPEFENCPECKAKIGVE